MRKNAALIPILSFLFSFLGCASVERAADDTCFQRDSSVRVVEDYVVVRGKGTARRMWVFVAVPHDGVSSEEALEVMHAYLNDNETVASSGEYLDCPEDLRLRDYWALAFSSISGVEVVILSSLHEVRNGAELDESTISFRDGMIDLMLAKWAKRTP